MLKKGRTYFIVGLVAVFAVGFYYLFPTIFAEDVYPLNYVNEIKECADMFELDRPLLAAMIFKESRFNPTAVSPAGAKGLAQLMPPTARGLNERVFHYENYDLFDPKTSACFGAAHLAGLMGTYNGDWEVALIAYNAGDGAARRFLASKRSNVALAAETKAYAPKILAVRDIYASQYAEQLGSGTVKEPEVKEYLKVQGAGTKANVFWKNFLKDAFAPYFSR